MKQRIHDLCFALGLIALLFLAWLCISTRILLIALKGELDEATRTVSSVWQEKESPATPHQPEAERRKQQFPQHL